ncbi:DUF3592 domain-containing protein [Eoetvoesiella caeni]|uniref:Uncharacterized protein DUF3592 n=1 Tax=Eoetvoesiella caeni TaxID=645616 RepID=A0A366H8I2_9BURK|nr:DUF3592 domain-containing protein [Eoetvoesiella caeni]MCI2810149.1 DUF3592 domain-containing protein [Eoetvoesiella caeni]NYT56469.1 DUF3592 domain-containing protein [Eoetvoesiella caeni]RBP37897.1 uncharacterized protein DUF3592 [Eoetvoesiella caeni]
MTRRTRWTFFAIFTTIGVAFAVAAWSDVSTYRTLYARGVHTEAEILRYEGVLGRRGTRWYPVYRFTTADGRSVEVRSADSASPSNRPRGTRLAVVYDPEHPDTLRTATALKGGVGVMPWFLVLISLLMWGIASLFLMPKRETSVLQNR